MAVAFGWRYTDKIDGFVKPQTYSDSEYDHLRFCFFTVADGNCAKFSTRERHYTPMVFARGYLKSGNAAVDVV